MPNYRTKDIRNVALVGHSGSGKTTLAEALLVKSGVKGEAGTIERGTTTTDHDPLEKEFQSSLDSAIASLDFEDYPFEASKADHACDLCGAGDSYLDEVIVDDTGGRMFVCSDTDYCRQRRAAGHMGAQGVPYEEGAA